MNSNPNLPETVKPAPAKPARHFGAFRYSTVELLGSLGLLFAAAPLAEDMPGGDLVKVLLITAVLISRLVAVYSSTQAVPRESFPPGQT